MKKLFVAVIAILFMTSPAWSIPYTGTIDSDDGGLFATEDWMDGNASFSWEVEETSLGIWTYAYSWSGGSKELSHINIEVSENFTIANILEGTTPGWDLDFHGEDNGNPEIPSTMYGLKWETSGDSLTFDFTIVTDREPMWGDMYAKDGSSGGNGGNDVIAYNTGFGSFTAAAIGNGNAMTNGSAWVLVPDTNGGGGQETPIPEPSTMLLLGGGLLGLGIFGRRRSRRS